MSGAQWEYRPEGSGGPGHMQRVGSPGEYSRTRQAYRGYLDHRATCPDCGRSACAAAEGLWQAYAKAQSGDDE